MVLGGSIATSAGAATYYVDANSPSCSSSGPGTEGEPYCTISSAIAAHNGPGVVILVKPGTYREQVSIPSSGVSGSPFVIRALGSNVIVDGADDFGNALLWSNTSGDTWLATGVTWEPKQVFVNGARLDSSVAAPDLAPGSYTWVSGQGLFANVGGGNPGLHDVLVGRRARGFTLFAKSFVTIDGFQVMRSDDRGIYLQNSCANVTIVRNRVSLSMGNGLQAAGGSNIVFEENVASENGGHGIALISGATGCAIRDNEIFGNADPNIRISNGIYLFGAPSNTISGNRMHDNQDSGMHIQTGSDNCISFNNVSWSNGDHGYDHLIATGTIHTNDVAYANNMDGFSIEGSATGTQLSNCVSVNNGLTTNRYNLWIDGNSTPGFVSNFNIFWNSTSQPPVKYVATAYPTLDPYRTASGQDAQTLQSDPKFVDPSEANFRLLPDSPAIDSGDSGSPMWPASDAEGSARVDIPAIPNTGAGNVTFSDRGAFERGSSAVDVPTPAPRAQALRIFPNPTRGGGTVQLALERPSRLRVQVLDITGRVMGTLADREASAGRIELTIPGQSEDGRQLASGVYFVRVEALGRITQGRFQILR